MQDGEPPLFIALAEGHSKVVEVLLKYQADPSYKDKVLLAYLGACLQTIMSTELPKNNSVLISLLTTPISGSVAYNLTYCMLYACTMMGVAALDRILTLQSLQTKRYYMYCATLRYNIMYVVLTLAS